MSKVERLNARVAKLLTVAVQEVLEVVRETVSEYQEKTARTQRENERLRRRLQELQDKQRKESIDLSSSTAGGGAAGGTPKMPLPSQNAFPLKEEQASEHTPADIEQITIKCESPRENNETSCEEMPVAQDADITKDGDEDSVHFVACYRNAVPTEKPSSKKSHSLPQKCKIETVTEMPSEARTTPESEFFRDKVLCSRGSPTHWSSGLIGAQHSEPRLNHALEPDPSVCVRVNSSPANALHTSLSGMASRPYLTVKTQIKTEADVDDCSNSAPQRDDYATADFNGLRDEIALSQDQQVATAVVAAASTSSRMSHIPLSANAAHNDSLFLENGCEAMPQDASSASMGVQLVRRGLGGVASGGALMGGRLPRPYTRHHVNHMGALPKRYCCGVCGRSFNHAGDFKKHKRVHTGEKPYACGVCGKRFSQSGYLTVHLRYHTGERPYSCGLCGRSFSHSSNFRKHQQTHIGQMMSNT